MFHHSWLDKFFDFLPGSGETFYVDFLLFEVIRMKIDDFAEIEN